MSKTLIAKTLRELDRAATAGVGQNLYDANKAVYRLLRYGVKVKKGAGQQNQTVWLIDWKHPEKNDFAIAEEVTIKGENKKRPDIVLYVNGIALGILELKRSSVAIGEGIRQNLDNQKKTFIRPFFTTLQIVMAGNDTQGLRYGTIETSEKYYLQWKEAVDNPFDSPLDWNLSLLCNKARFLEIIHDFIVFDSGTKKTCRHNQYFGIQAAKQHIQRREGGIIWHTQGSGKSLTMVWLAKWIRENVTDARVLIITDRTDLDDGGICRDGRVVDRQSEPFLGNRQVAGAGDRQELGEPLHDAQDDGVEIIHAAQPTGGSCGFPKWRNGPPGVPWRACSRRLD